MSRDQIRVAPWLPPPPGVSPPPVPLPSGETGRDLTRDWSAQPPATQMLMSIGDIAVYQDRVVTPSGVFPHTGLTWVVRDNTTTTRRIPPYAIVLAIIFALACLLGLLFLLINEERMSGYVDVSVQSASGYHVTQVPVSNVQQVDYVRQQVDYARGIRWNQVT